MTQSANQPTSRMSGHAKAPVTCQIPAMDAQVVAGDACQFVQHCNSVVCLDGCTAHSFVRNIKLIGPQQAFGKTPTPPLSPKPTV